MITGRVKRECGGGGWGGLLMLLTLGAVSFVGPLGMVESLSQLGRVSKQFFFMSPCNEQVLSAGGND